MWLLGFGALLVFFAGGLGFASRSYLHDGPLGEAMLVWHRLAENLGFPFTVFFWKLPLPLWGAAKILGPVMAWLTFAGMLRVTPLAVRRIRLRLARRRAEAAGQESTAAPEPMLSRRAFLTSAVTLNAGAALAVAYPTFVEPGQLRVRRYEVDIAGLPAEFDGLRVGHISDTHLGPYIRAPHIEAAVRMLAAEKPDLTLLTGDYIHRTPETAEDSIALLAPLAKAGFGAAAVLGNHDYEFQSTDKAITRAFERHGATVLTNRHIYLTPQGLRAKPAPGQPVLCVAGVDDLWRGNPDIDAALRGVPAEVPRLLLSHNPDVAELFVLNGRVPPRVDLMLSGHTHGGQVIIPGLGAPGTASRYGQKYVSGLVQGPRWPVIITHGVGMAVMPLRFCCPPEVGLVVLRRKP